MLASGQKRLARHLATGRCAQQRPQIPTQQRGGNKQPFGKTDFRTVDAPATNHYGPEYSRIQSNLDVGFGWDFSAMPKLISQFLDFSGFLRVGFCRVLERAFV